MTIIPKPASTVALMDHMSRVYLTKRPRTMKFLGGVFVFPGGSVEKEDSEVEIEYINGKTSEEFSQAYYVAAARELFEEVGILLVCKDDGSTVQFNKETEREYRSLLVEGKISFLQMLKQEKLHLNFENLKYFGNLITPKMSPIRFDTRFFLANMPEDQTPKPDHYEIDEALWITPREAITAYENGGFPVASPTILALRTIINHQNGGPLMMPVV
ncbi:NUDIX hydrolase [Alkalihalobacillus deserti]|uniref:NUDIX hydrolase n=1 Tax=Alkalihalobacillus deserti TaxID=2879466 RepID=UPI001D14CF58|nr:NUDIX domain-containing protein [Alkalihalobacillus deserti]